MDRTLCGSAVLPRGAERRLLGMSLVLAAGVLAAAWLCRSDVSPIAPLVVLVLSGLIGGWMMNRHAVVRGMPLVAAGVMTVVLAVGLALRGKLLGMSDGTLFMAILLSSVSRTRSSCAIVIALLAGADLLTLFI